MGPHPHSWDPPRPMVTWQVAMRRAWLDAAPTREVIASTATFELSAAMESGGLLQSNDTQELTERLSQLWAGLGGRILGLAPGAAAADMIAASAAAQFESELALLRAFAARGDVPPSDAHAKSELFNLLGSPLSRLAMLAPSSSVEIMIEMRRVQERIAASSRVGEQLGALTLVTDTLKSAHGLVDLAERRMDEGMREAAAKSEALRRAYGTRGL